MLRLSNEQIAKRNELIEEARGLTNDTVAFEAKMKEIEEFTNKAEEENRNLANLNALEDKNKITNVYAGGVKNVVGNVVDSIGNIVTDENFSNSLDYRKAFMNYVTKGTTIPGEFKNAAGPTKTGDAGEMIPDVVLSKIIEKMEATGMILPLVTRTSYKGGLTIPTSTVKPVATWIAEGATSEKQNKTTGSITFAYHKLRCAISNSLEVDTMALPVFETTFINNVVEAMTKALELSIVKGTGTGQPKGILTETVTDGQNVDVAADGKLVYNTLISAESALPLAYENGAVWFMTKKTFMVFMGMVDSNGQPISRVNYGINGQADRSLLGRRVVLNDYMDSYADTVDADKIVAFLFNPSDYILNTNLNMTIKRYEDNDTDDLVTKALMLADGKVVDKNSLVTITKKKA